MVKKVLTYKTDLNFKDNEQWTALLIPQKGVILILPNYS